jgi:hypothetical protein
MVLLHLPVKEAIYRFKALYALRGNRKYLLYAILSQSNHKNSSFLKEFREADE